MAEETEDRDKARSSNTRLFILLGVLVGAFIVALTVGLVLHFELNDDDDDNKEGSSLQRLGVIVDCMPELQRDEEKMRENRTDCLARGCEWKKREEEGVPWCIFPEDHGYKMSGPIMETASGFRVELSRLPTPKLYETETFESVSVDVEQQTDNRVRVKIYPKGRRRWEVPTDALNIEATNNITSKLTSLYNVTFTERPFGVAVTRVSTGAVVFNTSLPGLVVSDQFLQVTTRLTTENVFGFGEHRHKTFKHDMRWKLWSMFTRDSGPNSDWNLYGHHPVHMNVEEDGRANMVLLKNTNAMEVLLQPNPAPAITYRTIGGVLDFYIFLGESPQDVLQHYIKAIGQPVFPPYWSLGYHLCRWGYTGIADMREVINRNIAAGIPYDAQWADIDTFHKAFVFTFDKTKWSGFPALVDELKTKKMRFITIVDPGIGVDPATTLEVKGNFTGYDILQSGEDAGVFVKAPDNTTLYGEVWPGTTAFPDFSNDRSQDWWTRWITFYRTTVGVKVDALWIDMNEPANFAPGSIRGCEKNKLNNPPYVPKVQGSDDDGKLYEKTLCMDSTQALGLHYDVHSLYAHTMAMRTYRSLETIFPRLRPWTMTRSSYVGTGRYATKWQGDNLADWSNMHYSIISLMEFGMFGFPMNGADICGFWLEPSFELCVRWHQLGAFYPFARNHNGKGDYPQIFKHQDPAAFGQKFVDLVKPVLLTRYKFLPYLYSLLYRAHVEGDIVFKPLFFEFPENKETLTIDKQFMLGPAFLLSPVLEENAREVTAYFPQGRWFDYLTGESVQGPRADVVLPTPLNKFNLHLRAGKIIPWQEPDVTTADSREKGLGLLVVLDDSYSATGELFWDDGVSLIQTNPPNYFLIKFEIMKAGELTIRPEVRATGFLSTLTFKTLEIYGLPRLPSEFKVNGVVHPETKVKVFNNNIIRLVDLQNVLITASSTITWSVY